MTVNGGLITACVIVKDEASYLLEWIAFHKIVGFDKFVFYTNDCRDSTCEILGKLEKEGLLKQIDWPSRRHLSPQLTAYADFLSRCDTEWFLCFDIDEFLVLKKDASIKTFLGSFGTDISAIAINWRVFGTSGHLTREAAPVIERFKMASKVEHHINRHCKTIGRTQNIESIHVHRCFVKEGRYVDESENDIEIENWGFTPVVKTKRTQLNHYVLKSKEEFELKRARGNANRSLESVDKFTSRDGNYFGRLDLNDHLDETAALWLNPFKEEHAKLINIVEA